MYSPDSTPLPSPRRKTPDVVVSGGPDVFRFYLVSRRARAWVKAHVSLEPWQWWGRSSFFVEWRYWQSLARAMTADGLEVR